MGTPKITLNNKLCGNTYLSKHIERIEELVDKVKELHNNNLARVEEEVLHLEKVEVPINADNERVEEVKIGAPAAINDYVVEIVEYDEFITEDATKKSDIVIDEN